MSDSLRKMAEEEGLHLAERSFAANSHKALLLSEAAKEEGERIFYALHDSIFKAYFTEGQNISDPNILQALAGQAGVSEETVHKAWKESRYEAVLNETLELASSKGINGVPTFSILDGWWIEGHIEGATGWAIGDSYQSESNREQEVISLYDKLERIIVPMYYEQPNQFAVIMRSAIAHNGSYFNTQRMVNQYLQNAYLSGNHWHNGKSVSQGA